jgi:hypothetical protein
VKGFDSPLKLPNAPSAWLSLVGFGWLVSIVGAAKSAILSFLHFPENDEISPHKLIFRFSTAILEHQVVPLTCPRKTLPVETGVLS